MVIVVQQIIAHKKHPEQACRSCLGLLNLSKQYDAQRVDRACFRAVTINSVNIKSITSILKQGIDQLDFPLRGTAIHEKKQTKENTSEDHDNIRGADYYH